MGHSDLTQVDRESELRELKELEELGEFDEFDELGEFDEFKELKELSQDSSLELEGEETEHSSELSVEFESHNEDD